MDLEETDIKRRRRIDEERKRRVRELYRPPQNLSMNKIAEQLDIGTTSVWRILVSGNEPRRTISEACMKYPKTDFSGDPAEQARIIGFIEDCNVRYHRRQILIKTATTHLPQIDLFSCIFDEYGHIRNSTSYIKRYFMYQWQMQVLLNDSFDFVIEYRRNPLNFLCTHIGGNNNVYIYIGSLTDAEGSVYIDANSGRPRAVLSISNNNTEILEFTQRTLGGIIAAKRATPELQLRGEEAVEALQRIPLCHSEKVAAKELILRHHENGGIGLEALREYRELRRKIDDEVSLCKSQARLEWIRRHGKPHKDDADQTMPPS